jgi:hypothetical protein
VRCERPIVAEDKQTVGWLIDYENCCTSYPIPLTLVIFRSGEIIQRVKPGLMIFDWCFLDEGRKIALSSGTVHGMTYCHLNLYNARTGRLLKSWDGGFDHVAPAWARVYLKKQAASKEPSRDDKTLRGTYSALRACGPPTGS